MVPLVADASLDVVLSNCVLNLVNPSARQRLLSNIRRVLAPGGRVAISDIVCDQPVPLALQQDPELWSGCISGAWLEPAFLDDFRSLGFEQVRYADRSESPWRVVDGIEFRAVTLVGELPRGVAPLLLSNRISRCCSVPLTSRQAPGSSPFRFNGSRPSIRSMLRRISRSVGSPTEAVMRLTWRLRPSCRPISSQLVGMLAL